MSPAPPAAMPSKTWTLTERVFAFATLTTLLVSLALAAGLGVIAIFALFAERSTREALELSKQNTKLCSDLLIRSDAKREQMEKLIEFASGRKISKDGMGGP